MSDFIFSTVGKELRKAIISMNSSLLNFLPVIIVEKILRVELKRGINWERVEIIDAQLV